MSCLCDVLIRNEPLCGLYTDGNDICTELANRVFCKTNYYLTGFAPVSTLSEGRVYGSGVSDRAAILRAEIDWRYPYDCGAEIVPGMDIMVYGYGSSVNEPPKHELKIMTLTVRNVTHSDSRMYLEFPYSLNGTELHGNLLEKYILGHSVIWTESSNQSVNPLKDDPDFAAVYPTSATHACDKRIKDMKKLPNYRVTDKQQHELGTTSLIIQSMAKMSYTNETSCTVDSSSVYYLGVSDCMLMRLNCSDNMFNTRNNKTLEKGDLIHLGFDNPLTTYVTPLKILDIEFDKSPNLNNKPPTLNNKPPTKLGDNIRGDNFKGGQYIVAVTSGFVDKSKLYAPYHAGYCSNPKVNKIIIMEQNKYFPLMPETSEGELSNKLPRERFYNKQLHGGYNNLMGQATDVTSFKGQFEPLHGKTHLINSYDDFYKPTDGYNTVISGASIENFGCGCGCESQSCNCDYDYHNLEERIAEELRENGCKKKKNCRTIRIPKSAFSNLVTQHDTPSVVTHQEPCQDNIDYDKLASKISSKIKCNNNKPFNLIKHLSENNEKCHKNMYKLALQSCNTGSCNMLNETTNRNKHSSCDCSPKNDYIGSYMKSCE